MNKMVDQFVKWLNISNPFNHVVVLIFCVILTCVFADLIGMTVFKANMPETVASYESKLRQQIFMTSLPIATLFFTIFLYSIKRLEVLRAELATKIRYDSLTGILSREAFLRDFEKEQVMYGRDAFLVIDADYFKQINDTYGHHVGDKALIEITNALKSGIRKTDRIGRIGGEEFAVHLKSVSNEKAAEIAERLRTNVEKANERFEFGDKILSISIGAVVYNQKIDVKTLLRKADKLLYRAKETGRNKVMYENIEASVPQPS